MQDSVVVSRSRVRRRGLLVALLASIAVMAIGAPAALATAPDMVVTDIVVNDPGSPPSAFVTFTNEGDASAEIDSLTFADAGLWFSGRDHDDCSGSTIAIDNSCTIHVTGTADTLTFAFLTGPSQDVYVDIQ